jgi:glycerate 2-kinase
MKMSPDVFLRRLFDAALAAADPARCLSPHLASMARPPGRTIVLGAGKAAASMAKAVETHWPGPIEGFVVTPYGYGLACQRIEVFEAAHPVPDAAGMAAARRMLATVGGLTENDLVLALVSGGGSALLALPAAGITLADKQAVTRQLLKSGASIHEINTVRKRLSAIKGGRLALAAWPARVLTLAVSDVPGDDPADIASGPTVPDHSSEAEALAVLERYGVQAPGFSPPPALDDPRFARCEAKVIATGMTALEAAAAEARRQDIIPVILGDAIEGESREVARAMAARSLLCAADGEPARAPCVLLSGGETTVRVKGRGRGGRNSEFLLALAIALRGAPGIHAIACDTDGIDGSADNAGATIGPDTLARARALGLDAASHLADNDAHGFFAGLGDLVSTGPTRTNVNDFRAILIDGRS